MNLPKWAWIIIAAAIVFGLLIVTNAHFGANVGMGSKSFTVGVQ